MARARKKAATIRAVKYCAKTRRSGGRKQKSEKKHVKLTGIGGAVSSQEDKPPNRDNPTSPQTAVKGGCSTQTVSLPEEPENSKMCSKCFTALMPAVLPAGWTTSLRQCPRCSTTPLCEKCLYSCPDGTCTNQSCQVVSLLLSCAEVTKSSSHVRGCPLFRACPKCRNVMMHDSGCKYVSCAQCMHSFCFICLRTRQVCAVDKKNYWSLSCSAPTAARQRFQT